jgi:iron complex outermembrane receptor protein
VDLQTFRYVNIGRSRHRGVEAALDLDGPGGIGAWGNYTLQSVTFRNGDHQGNALKAIPRHSLGTGLRMGSRSGLAGSVAAKSAWGIYLDDANTVRLPGYTRLDARLSYPIAGVRLDVEVFNLLDREYSTTGYPDPAGSDLVYYYPAAGRMLQLGVSSGW